MGTKGKLKCGCKSNITIDGDAIGRVMAKNYYAKNDTEKFACLDCANSLYCCFDCKDNDTYFYKCGSMYVCSECAIDHNKTTLIPIETISDEFGTDAESGEDIQKEWEYAEYFKKKCMHWIIENPKESIVYLWIANTGPQMTMKDNVNGDLYVNSAKSALMAANLYPQKQKFFEFLAGWYHDCPDNVEKFI